MTRLIVVETVNMAWQLGGNAELLAEACAGADVVLIDEALADGGKAVLHIKSLLPTGWLVAQDVTSPARAGSAVAWNPETMAYRLHGHRRMSRRGFRVRERWMTWAQLEHRETGDDRRYSSPHAPLLATGRKAEFLRHFRAWLGSHSHAISGGDLNMSPRRAAKRLGRTVVGDGVICITIPRGLRLVSLSARELPWSDHRLVRIAFRGVRR